MFAISDMFFGALKDSCKKKPNSPFGDSGLLAISEFVKKLSFILNSFLDYLQSHVLVQKTNFPKEFKIDF